MTTIKFRRGTTAQWATANPILAAAEPGVDLDTRELRFGDGATAWDALPSILPHADHETGLRQFAGKLASGSGTPVVAIAGDSTGDEGPEWFKRAMTQIASDKPWVTANYHAWDHATQAYVNSAIQTGAALTSLPQRLIWDTFTRTAANVVSTNVTPERGQVTTWSGGAGLWSVDGSKLVALAAGSGINLGPTSTSERRKLSWAVTLDTTTATKTISLAFGSSGSNRLIVMITAATGTCTWKIYKQLSTGNADLVGSTALTLSGGATASFTVTLEVNGSAVTAAIDSQTLSGTLSGAEVAALAGGCRVYVDTTGAVADGAGTKLDDLIVDLWPTRTVQAMEIYNGSRAGTTLAYQLDRIDALYPVRPDVLFISSSHNYDAMGVDAYLAVLDGFMDAFRAKWPTTEIVLCSQNPETPPRPADRIAAHAARCAALPAYAARNRCSYLPVWEAFEAAWTPVLVRADGLHPTGNNVTYDGTPDPQGGSYQWAKAAVAWLRAKGVPATPFA